MSPQQEDLKFHFYGYAAGDDEDDALEFRFLAFHPPRYCDTAVEADPAPPALSAHLNAARDQLERGPGGDIDGEGQVTRRGIHWTPTQMSTIRAWQRLYERVQAGSLGGPQDGAA